MTVANNSATARAFLIFAVIAVLLGIGFHAERVAMFQPLRHSLQQRAVPSGMLSYGSMGKILRRLNLIQVLPDNESFFQDDTLNSVRSHVAILQKKSRQGIHRYGFGAVEPEEMPASTTIPPTVLDDPTPILSIAVAPSDLYDPALGLIVNSDEKGRNWERPAYIAYFEGGELLFATGAGIRIHGGVARDAEKKSFRVYFRDIYGADQFKPGILFDRTTEPLRRFVVRSEYETAGLFANSVAYDISRHIGAIAPQTHTVRLFLNGAYQGVYILIEHIGEDYLKAHYGHARFLLARAKSSEAMVMGNPETYEQFRQWASARTPLTMTEAAQKVDLDNLSRWIISVLFCSTPDALQGPIALDLQTPKSRWFWINWDMDHSLVKTNLHYAENAWEEDIFERFYLTDPRSMLYHRLRLGSPEFRHYFTRLFVDIMNHRLTPDFLQERLDYYAGLARSFGQDTQEFNEEVAQFFAHRHAVLRQQMKTYFATGDSYSCQVDGPDGVEFKIDGYPEKPGYLGWYFAHTPITVVAVEPPQQTFSHWRINGTEINTEKTLRYMIESDTNITAVFLAEY